jgi:osmotically inducible protein OsmC
MATTTPIVRHATVRWVGSPPHGTARAQVDSHAFTALPVSVNRGSPTPGKTTPGELLAAAYATFLATRVARQLERDGDPAHELVVDVSCLISDWESITVAGFQVDVHGRVRGIDRNRFRSDVQADVRSCSQAFGLRDDVPVELHTSLGS